MRPGMLALALVACGQAPPMPAAPGAGQGECDAPLPRELALLAQTTDDAFYRRLGGGLEATVTAVDRDTDPARGPFARIRADAAGTPVALVVFGTAEPAVAPGAVLRVTSRTELEPDDRQDAVGQRTIVVRARTGELLYAQATAVGQRWPGDLLPEVSAARIEACTVLLEGAGMALAIPSGSEVETGDLTVASSVSEGRFALLLIRGE